MEATKGHDDNATYRISNLEKELSLRTDELKAVREEMTNAKLEWSRQRREFEMKVDQIEDAVCAKYWELKQRLLNVKMRNLTRTKRNRISIVLIRNWRILKKPQKNLKTRTRKKLYDCVPKSLFYKSQKKSMLNELGCRK